MRVAGGHTSTLCLSCIQLYKVTYFMVCATMSKAEDLVRPFSEPAPSLAVQNP